MQPRVARRPGVAHQLAHRFVVQAHRHPDRERLHETQICRPQSIRNPLRVKWFRHRRQVQHFTGGPGVLQFPATHPIPVDTELLPRRRHRPHAHAVHPVPGDVFVEQLPFLRLGQTAAEMLRGQDRAHEERRVRPVEDVGIQRAVVPAPVVDPLDRNVVIPHLGPGHRGAFAVEHHAADRVEGAEQPRDAFGEEDRVLLDRGAELRVHILHRARPRTLQQTAPVAEDPPGQRIGPERGRRRVVAAARYRATGVGRHAIAGERVRVGRILTQLVTFPGR